MFGRPPLVPKEFILECLDGCLIFNMALLAHCHKGQLFLPCHIIVALSHCGVFFCHLNPNKERALIAHSIIRSTRMSPPPSPFKLFLRRCTRRRRSSRTDEQQACKLCFWVAWKSLPVLFCCVKEFLLAGCTEGVTDLITK